MNKGMYADSDGKKKLPYESPRIVAIELLADEVLAIGCKTPTVSNPGNPDCALTPCVDYGS